MSQTWFRGAASNGTAIVVVTLLALALLSNLAPQAGVEERPGPDASEPVERILQEVRRQLDAGERDTALQTCERALAAAHQFDDVAGEAQAYALRAESLDVVSHRGEAVEQWRAAAEAWGRVGFGPGRVEALAAAGLLLVWEEAEEAKPLFDEARRVAAEETERPLAAARALHQAGDSAAQLTRYAAGVELLETALIIREAGAPDSWEVVETLTLLGGTSIRVAPDKARAHLERAAELCRQLNPDALQMALVHDDLAFLEWWGGEYPKVTPHYLRSLEIKERSAPDSETLAGTLSAFGKFETGIGELASAQEHLERALAIQERLSPGSRDTARTLKNLGVVCWRRADLEAARDYYLQGLEMERARKPNMVAAFQINLGVVAADRWDFATARAYFHKALDDWKQTNPRSPGVAFGLGNLGEIAARQGDWEAALDYGLRSLSLMEELLPNTLNLADQLVIVGNAYRALDRFDPAEEYYRRALDIAEKQASGAPSHAQALEKLGQLAQQSGGRELASRFFDQARKIYHEIQADSLGEADQLIHLAGLAEEVGNYDSAVEHSRTALAIREKRLGAGHPVTAEALATLSRALLALGQNEQAFEAALRAERIGSDHARLTARALSERQALRYASVRASGLDAALTLAPAIQTSGGEPARVWDAVIRSRAAVLDELAERTRIASQTSDDEISRLMKELRRARQRLANLTVRGPLAEPEEYRTRLDEARAWKNAAEQKLATASLAFRGKLLLRRATWRDVQAALPPETALVAYVRYNHYEMEAKRSASTGSAAAGGDSTVLSRVPRYAVFVLRAASGEPRLLSLGDAAGIERQITRWGQEAARGLRAPGWTAKQAEDACRSAGQTLRELIWDPVEPYLEGASTVLVVPDAALHAVNLAALPAGEAEYLLEQGPTIHYLSTERDVVAFRESRSEGSGMLAVGAPDFDTPAPFAALATGDAPRRAAASTDDGAVAFRGERSSCGDFASLDFAELPASVREVKEVVQLWKRGPQGSAGAVRLMGVDATEQAFKAAAPGKRVLHIATHGFFLEGRCPSSAEVKRGARTIENLSPSADAENPLLLCGLALAGANRRSAAGPEEEDGILTGEEVAALDLSGTEWAVLSACDTGVGDLKAGEGVFGLQRAFRIAGVRTLIVSLWAVEDEAVRQWMAELYRNHFLEGQTTAEAVRAASLVVLQERRRRGLDTHPFHWAAFVASGDWR